MQACITALQPLPQHIAILRRDEEVVESIRHERRTSYLLEEALRAFVAERVAGPPLYGGDLVLQPLGREHGYAVRAQVVYTL